MSEENIEATEPEPEDLDKIANDFVDSLLLSDEENENQLPEEQNNSTATPKNADLVETNESSTKSKIKKPKDTQKTKVLRANAKPKPKTKQNSKNISDSRKKIVTTHQQPQTSAKKKLIKKRNNDNNIRHVLERILIILAKMSHYLINH